MSELVGNMLVAQSGGPTAVINASIAGAVSAAWRNAHVFPQDAEGETVGTIYGAQNGILGILNEELIDLSEVPQSVIEGLRHTPAAALGTCRYKINFTTKPDQARVDMDRLFAVFQAHDIRYFFYAGGNDSQDTSLKIHQQAIERGYELRVIGIPKTIDNDLPHTDHCPGYGSVIKYCATTVMEVGLDVGSMATDDGSCCVVEVMGRSAGWIAAGTVLARRFPADPPHIILVPEIRYDIDALLARIKECVASFGYCVVVAGEGIKDSTGKEIGADFSQLDDFGHPLLSGAAERLGQIIFGKLGTKTRTVKLGYAQRAAAHCGSATDAAEAFACGEAAVQAAVSGQSGYMVKLVRDSSSPYRWSTALHPLAEIANVEHFVPRDWISEDGFLPNEKFVEYARPLIEGETRPPAEGGLPKFVAIEKARIEKKLPARIT